MKKNEMENQNRDSYRTGSTKPPKSYQGIIAVLLILVIFLGGIVSVLSMMNIRMFQMLEAQSQTQESLLQFSRQADALPASADSGLFAPGLGLTGQEVTELCRSYYGWPAGLYISAVAPGSAAEKAGLCQGDILSAVNGRVLDSEAALSGILMEKKSGDTVLLTVFRGGSSLEVSVVLD